MITPRNAAASNARVYPTWGRTRASLENISATRPQPLQLDKIADRTGLLGPDRSAELAFQILETYFREALLGGRGSDIG